MKKLIHFVGYLFGVGSILALTVIVIAGVYISGISEDLPDYSTLKNYEPPVITRVHASNGQLMSEFARERRLFLAIQAVPEMLKNAYLSAEDKDFYSHGGLDFTGILNAAIQNVINYGTGRRPVGASTITQQVAKNFFFTNEVSYERKLKEAVLAKRIELAFTKDEILELYLNEIYLGLGAYGIAAASLIYFDKAVHDLTLSEMAYLAALPKAPNNYHPVKNPDQAIARRNWVLDRMVANNYISAEELKIAQQEQMKFKFRQEETFLLGSDYFAEEVRRELAELYGEEGLYGGGLSVRTTMDPYLQVLGRNVLMEGLTKFDIERGYWRGPIKNVDLEEYSKVEEVFDNIEPLADVPEWNLAVVTEVDGSTAKITVQVGVSDFSTIPKGIETGNLSFNDMKWARTKSGKQPRSIREVLNPGDVVFVEDGKKSGVTSSKWVLRQIPEVSGALVAMDPYTGRVLALSGGFSYSESEFNRATQAYRQPGSSFKPIVYASALDNGYTPSSVVMDAPFAIDQGSGLGIWRPSNYTNEYYGPSTLRIGLEQSRNVMTVRLAQDMGMPLIADYAQRFGIKEDMPEVLSMALGAGETTVLRLTTAYSILANGGKKIVPTLIDRVQDRYGRTIFKHDNRKCDLCTAKQWDQQDEPEVVDERKQILDRRTAYQITSMLEGVVRNGTGGAARRVGKPIAGKTGTTNEEKDAWFVGYSPNLAVGIFIGYDQPRRMGRGATGGQIAAPIFTEFMQKALEDEPGIEFRVPRGIELITINRKTGLTATPGSQDSILEAFKTGTTPPDTYSIIGYRETPDGLSGKSIVTPETERAISVGTGGLY